MTRSAPTRPLVQPNQDEHTHKLQLQSVRRQQTAARRAIQQIRDRGKRQVIVGVTLGYNDDYRATATFADMQRDRAKLLRAIEQEPNLKFVHDAFHKAEEGENGGGIHLHAFLFGDGRYWRGMKLCKAVGEHWRDVITEGRGSYRNGNSAADKAEKAIKGAKTPEEAEAKAKALPYGNITGQIDPHDEKKWEGVTGYVTEYLCKATQPIASRGKHDQTFGTRNFRDNRTKY